ncbi:MAG: cysteine peptidase family C39 domain-containing protein [Bacteroidota bacterium]
MLKKHGLKYRKTRDLKNSIDHGYPVLVSTHKHWHYSVVYGYSKTHYFVMNPSLGDMGRLSCVVNKKEFKRVWDAWALEIR